MLHFAYGANMNRAVMHRHAPAAQPLGVAALAHHRFVITADGYASVVPARGETVHGVLWRLGTGDRAALDAWENVAGGLYRARMLPVRQAGRRRVALVYLARPRPEGFARAGYLELVIAAALEWRLPQAYIGALSSRVPRRPTAGDSNEFGAFGWT
jgi:cation transport regulator ChaC